MLGSKMVSSANKSSEWSVRQQGLDVVPVFVGSIALKMALCASPTQHFVLNLLLTVSCISLCSPGSLIDQRHTHPFPSTTNSKADPYQAGRVGLPDHFLPVSLLSLHPFLSFSNISPSILTVRKNFLFQVEAFNVLEGDSFILKIEGFFGCYFIQWSDVF